MTYYSDHQKQDLLHEITSFSGFAGAIFRQAIDDYHITDSIDAPASNPYPGDSIEHLFYAKCYTDAVQWHVEDEIRSPDIDAARALKMKRRIDSLNQERTDKVELIDNYFLMKFHNVPVLENARLNSESPAWALDRLSILELKLYHMKVETTRVNVSQEHTDRCLKKLTVLMEQHKDLSLSINELISDLSEGKKLMKVYRQMKMYNDPSLNPILYKTSKL